MPRRTSLRPRLLAPCLGLVFLEAGASPPAQAWVGAKVWLGADRGYIEDAVLLVEGGGEMTAQ